MKKILFFSVIGLAAFICLPIKVFAATTAILFPQNISLIPEQQFTVSVQIDPHTTANYAEKIEVIFPIDLVEVVSFNFASNWIPLTQSGYDTIDNNKGTLIKSAGYPGGITSPTLFGTISFKAKKKGSGNIVVGKNSVAFETQSETSLSGNSVMVSIVSPTIPPVTKKQNAKAVQVLKATTTESLHEVQPTIASLATTTNTVGTSSIAAAADTNKTSSARSNILYFFAGMLVPIVCFGVWRKLRGI